jgi:hypothetical protein
MTADDYQKAVKKLQDGEDLPIANFGFKNS